MKVAACAGGLSALVLGGCPPERIRVIRSEGVTVDLDVCGVVRRYKSVASGATSGPAYA